MFGARSYLKQSVKCMENTIHFSIVDSWIFVNIVPTFLDNQWVLLLLIQKSIEILANQEGNDRCHVCFNFEFFFQVAGIDEKRVKEVVFPSAIWILLLDYVTKRIFFFRLGKINDSWKQFWLGLTGYSHTHFHRFSRRLCEFLKFGDFFEFFKWQFVLHDTAFIDILSLLILLISLIDKINNMIIRIHAFDVRFYFLIAQVLFLDAVDSIGVDAEEGGVLCQNLVFYGLSDYLIFQFFLI